MNSVEFDNTEPLAELFKLGPLRYLTVAEIGRDKRMQFAQTYLMMARLGYPGGRRMARSIRQSERTGCIRRRSASRWNSLARKTAIVSGCAVPSTAPARLPAGPLSC